MIGALKVKMPKITLAQDGWGIMIVILFISSNRYMLRLLFGSISDRHSQGASQKTGQPRRFRYLSVR